jgi:two-component system, chemotaxis family, response regulator Rcp1
MFPRILIVEDNRADVYLIREAIRSAKLNVAFEVCGDGEEAMRRFDQMDADASAPCPGLVILDINLPKKSGGEVLQHMRESRRCKNALVVVVSTSDSPQDRKRMQELGANAYFRKPSEYDEFLKLGDVLKELLGHE